MPLYFPNPFRLVRCGRRLGWKIKRRERQEKEQAEREQAEKEKSVRRDLEQKPIAIPEPYNPPNLQYVPSYENKVTPVLTDTLGPAPEGENKYAK